MNATDTQRITRAIEVYLQTNKPMSEWQRQPKQALANNPEQQWHALSVMPDRPWLHQRIEQRLAIMWNEGLVEEVISLLEKYPLTPNMPSMRCVGYRQVLEYLVHIDHEIFDKPHLDKTQFYEAFAVPDSLTQKNETQNSDTQLTGQSILLNPETEALACQEMQNKALYATRQLAKRQYTWLRKVMQLPNASSTLTMGSDSTATNNTMVLKTFATMEQARNYLY